MKSSKKKTFFFVSSFFVLYSIKQTIIVWCFVGQTFYQIIRNVLIFILSSLYISLFVFNSLLFFEISVRGVFEENTPNWMSLLIDFNKNCLSSALQKGLWLQHCFLYLVFRWFLWTFFVVCCLYVQKTNEKKNLNLLNVYNFSGMLFFFSFLLLSTLLRTFKLFLQEFLYYIYSKIHDLAN